MGECENEGLRKRLEEVTAERDELRDWIVYLEWLFGETGTAATAYYEAVTASIRARSPVPPPSPIDAQKRGPLGVVQGGFPQDGGFQGSGLPSCDRDVSEVPGQCAGG